MANRDTAASDVVTFTEGDLDGEVNPLPVDPELFKLDNSNSNSNVDLKEQEEAKEEKEKNDGSQTFKSMIIVSGVVVAVIGAIFAITKKLRET